MLTPVLYGSVLGFAFLIVPFAYFWHDAKDVGKGFGRRLFDGCKFTVAFVLIITILFVVGLFVRIGGQNTGDPTFQGWVDALYDTTNSIYIPIDSV